MDKWHLAFQFWLNGKYSTWTACILAAEYFAKLSRIDPEWAVTQQERMELLK